eukprot:TRINITY_DN1403_c0_g1_i1.p1 TRINITY_DN1403_c0_g1~~TRINITY_DN1403_c0_g1_i1.p1  ORF type:complete len:867 (-),score=197.06 TRINITY_DN1403_c0_g1_i1:18-2618(-)
MGTTTSKLRAIFDNLDCDKDGYLRLSHLEKGHEQLRELGISFKRWNSLGTFYTFDKGKDGKLSFEEFCDLIGSLRRIEWTAKNKRRRKLFGIIPLPLCCGLRELNTEHGEKKENGQCLSLPNGEIFSVLEEFPIDQAVTVTLQGTNRGDGTFTHVNNNLFESFRSFSSEQVHEFWDRIQLNMKEEGRECWLKWLFTVIVEDSERIDVSKLTLLIKALHADGVEAETLLSDSDNEMENGKLHSPTSITERVLAQYDLDETGDLNYSEFVELAMDIMREIYLYQERAFQHRNFRNYTLYKTLGTGSMGIVKQARNDTTGEYVALKMCRITSDAVHDKLMSEIETLEKLRNCKHCVKLYEYFMEGDMMVIVEELCDGGDLHELLFQLPENTNFIKYYFKQLCLGVKELHDKNICHRDIRLENILLDAEGTIKLTDFGSAREFKKGWDMFNTYMVGGLYHLSPEQLEQKIYSGTKTDIWSLGIVLYCLVFRKRPFFNAHIPTMLEHMKSADWYVEDKVVDPEALSLLGKLLVKDPDERLTINEILEDPFIKEFDLSKFNPVLAIASLWLGALPLALDMGDMNLKFSDVFLKRQNSVYSQTSTINSIVNSEQNHLFEHSLSIIDENNSNYNISRSASPFKSEECISDTSKLDIRSSSIPPVDRPDNDSQELLNEEFLQNTPLSINQSVHDLNIKDTVCYIKERDVEVDICLDPNEVIETHKYLIQAIMRIMNKYSFILECDEAYSCDEPAVTLNPIQCAGQTFEIPAVDSSFLFKCDSMRVLIELKYDAVKMSEMMETLDLLSTKAEKLSQSPVTTFCPRSKPHHFYLFSIFQYYVGWRMNFQLIGGNLREFHHQYVRIVRKLQKLLPTDY